MWVPTFDYGPWCGSLLSMRDPDVGRTFLTGTQFSGVGPYFLIGDTGVGPYFLIGDPGVCPYFRLGTLVWVPSIDLEPGVGPYFLMEN